MVGRESGAEVVVLGLVSARKRAVWVGGREMDGPHPFAYGGRTAAAGSVSSASQGARA